MEIPFLEIGATTIVLVCSVLYLYYYYLTKYYGYLEAQGVPVSKPKLIYGTLDFKKPMWQTELEEYKKFGKFHGVYNGRMPGLMTSDPELLRQLFVKGFETFPHMREISWPKSPAQKYWYGMLFVLRHGEKWKSTRTVMSPTFTAGKLKQMSLLMHECCKPLQEVLAKKAEKNEPFELRRLFMDIALDVTASIAFGIKVDSLNNPGNPFAKAAFAIFGPKYTKTGAIIRYVFTNFLQYIPHTWFFGEEDPLIYLSNVIKEVLKTRNWKPQGRGDYLDLMLESKLETEENEEIDNTAGTKGRTKKKVLDEDSVVSQAVMFVTAGIETVAITLSWAVYCLALHAEIQEKLAEEVDRVLDENDDKLTYETVSKMPYLDMFVSEVLRKYPTVPRVERECVVNGAELNGVKLMKGMLIGFSTYAIHHDPSIYPDPEKFDPERFTPENKKTRDQFHYLPFGAGPRMCLGNRFALTEIKLVLASMVHNFRIKQCQKTEVPPTYAMSTFGLLQAESLTVAVEKIN